MMKYELHAVKIAARGRWQEVISAITGVSAEVLDGRHGPCPKCGGTDRFRMLDEKEGAVICNQCFSSKNGDGIAAIEWLNNCEFKAAVDAVGDYLRVPPKGKANDPAKDLEFAKWNDELALQWCAKKQPITIDALHRVGAKQAIYKGTRVLAIPTRNQAGNAVGWSIYKMPSGTLPRKVGNKIEQVKVKLTYGSKPGVIGEVRADATEYWKTEGPTDLLALLSLGLPPGASAFCNANGAKEDPAKAFRWVQERVKGKKVYVIHDCDEPGQEGATYIPRSDGSYRIGWAPFLAGGSESGTVAKNVVLPFEIEPTKGKDLRDWIHDGGTFEKLQALADQTTQFEKIDIGDEPKVKEAVDDPHRLARINLENYWKTQNRKLVYWHETWLVWKDGCYYEITKEHLIARINGSIKAEFDRAWREEYDQYQEWKNSSDYDEKKDKGEPVARKSTTSIIRNVYEATKSLTVIPYRVRMHDWIKDGEDGVCVSAKNGIINISKLIDSKKDKSITPSDVLLNPSPNWFSTSQVPFSYNPKALCPSWVKFLSDVFNGDTESIDLLQKWFGYLLTPDNSYNKILFVIGQPRSGKGTIITVLRSLLGDGNVATPTLTELGTQFGLQSMIGKTSAVITDARISNRADESAITERLLSISGNDPQNIQRKFKDTLSGFSLNVRFTLFSNLVPKLRDVSSAFLTRCLFLLMPNSYLGKEDTGLQDRLLAELPGILNWSIAGKVRLDECRHLHQPASGLPIKDELKSIVSPVLGFIEECLEFENSEDVWVETKELYNVWLDYCEKNDVANTGTIQSLARKIRAIQPALNIGQKRIGPPHNSHRVRVIHGAKLRFDGFDDE